MIYVFNSKTGKQISSIVKIGEGTDEYLATLTGYANQIEIENGICIWLFDHKKKRCVLIDWIDGNIRKEINVSSLSSSIESSMKYFILNDSLLLVYNGGEAIFVDNMGTLEDYFNPPKYNVFNYKTGQWIMTYEPYNKFKYNTTMLAAMSLYSWDRIKPDRTKLAMSMVYLGQINIMDIATGKITGYYIKDTPNFDVLRKHSNFDMRFFYGQTLVDDDFIYGVLNDSEDALINGEYRFINGSDKTTLYVFDWNGNFKKVLILDKAMESIALDPVNKQIYLLTNGAEDEEVYRYDVSYLYDK